MTYETGAAGTAIRVVPASTWDNINLAIMLEINHKKGKIMKKSKKKIDDKLLGLYRLLLGLNAYGSLELKDFRIIESYLAGAFKFDPDAAD